MNSRIMPRRSFESSAPGVRYQLHLRALRVRRVARIYTRARTTRVRADVHARQSRD